MRFSAIFAAAIVGLAISLSGPQADVPTSSEWVEVTTTAAS
ncbi:MAG: hypothetical protein AAF764_03040 [Pseudomonadota bacterium]